MIPLMASCLSSISLPFSFSRSYRISLGFLLCPSDMFLNNLDYVWIKCQSSKISESHLTPINIAHATTAQRTSLRGMRQQQTGRTDEEDLLDVVQGEGGSASGRWDWKQDSVLPGVGERQRGGRLALAAGVWIVFVSLENEGRIMICQLEDGY